jgi:hypothetical protein
MKAKLGRPKLDVTRDVLIGARFTPEEAALIDQVVKESGSVKSDWIRAVLLEAAGAKRESGQAARPAQTAPIYAGVDEEFLD